MQKCFASLCALPGLILAATSAARPATGTGMIQGTANDTNDGALPGARIALTPGNVAAATEALGNFVLGRVAPGPAKMTVTYVGFTPFDAPVTVAAGGVANGKAVLKVASSSQQVGVTRSAVQGEAEAVNEERTTPQDFDFCDRNDNALAVNHTTPGGNLPYRHYPNRSAFPYMEA